MAITRRYETEEECARLWINERFSNVPDEWFIGDDCSNWFERLSFYEYDSDESETELACAEPPMWSTWFVPDDPCDYRWIEENEFEIAKLGFTIIYRDCELFALGIDGAGYSFYDAHWIPLYRLRGFTWHESR